MNQMKKFKLYWLDGTEEIIKGYTIMSAFETVGYSNWGISFLDYYEEVM